MVEYFNLENRSTVTVVGHKRGGNVVLLYDSKYHDIGSVVNISGRYDLKTGITNRLGDDYMDRLKKEGYIDFKTKTEYSYLLDWANEWEKQGHSSMRILNAVSGYYSTEGRICKPFNPLLGETYEAEYPDKGLLLISEKVSHQPMIVACHCEGTGWRFTGDSNLKSTFWGRSIQLYPVGVLTVEFDDGEIFQWSQVTSSIYNLILGKLYFNHYSTRWIQGNHNYSCKCKLKFKEQSIIDKNTHRVQGVVQDKGGKTVATMVGKWDESMHFVHGDFSSSKSHEAL